MTNAKNAREQKEELERKLKEEEEANKAKEGGKTFAPNDKLPVAPKPDYNISPSMGELCRMSLEELENVENFKISNEFGSIEFQEAVDLTNVNLAEVVTITIK